MADETYSVWDPERSHPSFINIPTDFSSQVFTTISINKDCVRLTPLTLDATPINYNSVFIDREGNDSLKATFNNQESLNGTRNRTQQKIQTPSYFVNEEIVETMPTKTQQSISPIHLTLTTPNNKTTVFPLTTIQSTVKPSVIPKYSQMNYQTFRPVTTSRQTNRNNFLDHNYNFFPKIQNKKKNQYK